MSKETKEEKEKNILKYLMTGAKLTVYQATLLFRYTDLRKLMCTFRDERHLPTKSAYIAGENCKEYWISLEELAA